AGRDFQHDVGAVCAGALLAHAVSAAPRLEMLAVAVIDERVEARHRFGDDIAAAPAVAAVRASELDEFLAPERDAAVASVAGTDLNLGLVEELHRASSLPEGEGGAGKAPRRVGRGPVTQDYKLSIGPAVHPTPPPAAATNSSLSPQGRGMG